LTVEFYGGELHGVSFSHPATVNTYASRAQLGGEFFEFDRPALTNPLSSQVYMSLSGFMRLPGYRNQMRFFLPPTNHPLFRIVVHFEARQPISLEFGLNWFVKLEG